MSVSRQPAKEVLNGTNAATLSSTAGRIASQTVPRANAAPHPSPAPSPPFGTVNCAVVLGRSQQVFNHRHQLKDETFSCLPSPILAISHVICMQIFLHHQASSSAHSHSRIVDETRRLVQEYCIVTGRCDESFWLVSIFFSHLHDEGRFTAASSLPR
jgi:hypothetical protein